MVAPKLLEAIRDLEQKKRIIDEALTRLREALAILEPNENGNDHGSDQVSQPSNVKRANVRQGSHFDNAYSVLARFPAPLHVSDLQKYIEQMTGRAVTRASLEGAISRHIRVKGNESLITRVGPSKYAVRNAPKIPIDQ